MKVGLDLPVGCILLINLEKIVVKICIENTPADSDYDEVSEKLFEYNCEKSGVNDFKRFGVYLRNEDNKIIGGLNGWTRWEWAHIENLWIEESYRNQGFGKILLKFAEEISTSRNCKFIDLDTYSFQAPNFYKMNGYEELFIIDGMSKDIKKHFFKKFLKH